jgi:hypothetical protein
VNVESILVSLRQWPFRNLFLGTASIAHYFAATPTTGQGFEALQD